MLLRKAENIFDGDHVILDNEVFIVAHIGGNIGNDITLTLKPHITTIGIRNPFTVVVYRDDMILIVPERTDAPAT